MGRPREHDEWVENMGQRWIEMSTTADLHEVWSACHKYASSSGSRYIVIQRKTLHHRPNPEKTGAGPEFMASKPSCKKPASQSFFNAALDLARAFGQRADSRSDPASTILRWIRMDGLGVWGCVPLPSKDSYFKAFGPKDPIM